MKKRLFLFVAAAILSASASPIPARGTVSIVPARGTCADVEKDSRFQFLFSAEHPDFAAQITLKPKKFPIRAGETYFISHSDTGAPFRVKAEKDGELSFRRPAEIRTTFSVVKNLPNLIPAAQDMTVSKETHASVKNFTIAKIPVEPGKKYRGSFFFSQLEGTQGSAIGLTLRLTRGGKRLSALNNRYLYSFPLLKNSPASPRYSLEEIAVPAVPGKYELTFGVELSASAGKFRITRPEITLAPPRLWHRGKYSRGKLQGDTAKGAQIMSKYPPVNTEIRLVDRIPRVFCNGKIQTLVPIQAGSEEQIKAAYAAGYRIMMVALPVNNWGKKKGSVWQGPGKYDWSVIDKKLARMAELAPECRIMLLCGDIAYPDFAKDHPASKWITGNGKTGIRFVSCSPTIAFSYFGEDARRECGKFLYDLGKHLSGTPLGNQVISLHLSAGSDGQWYQPDRPWHFKKLDYSEAARKAVCRQLRQLYRNDINALRRAWNMPDADFDTLQTPAPQELADSSFLLNVRDPRHKRLIDWINADQLALIDAVDHYAGSFKAGFGRKVLVTTYAPYNRFINKTALFRTKNLDGAVYLSAYYRPRSSGGNGGNIYPVDSAVLHGKILLEEIDYRNEYFGYNGTNRSGQVAMADDDAAYMGQLLRAFGANWSRGGSGWFRPINQDSYLAWTGFYQRHLKEIKKAAHLNLRHGRYENRADILFFAGDDYPLQMSRKNNFDHLMDYTATNRLDLSSCGMSHRYYLLSDLQHPGRAQGKIYLFSGAASISAADVDYICQNLQKDGNVLIFTNDIGRNNPAGFSAVLKKLTGIDAVLSADEMTEGIYSNRIVNKLGIRDIPKMSVWVRTFKLPRITIDPAGTERIADLPSGLPGAVLKRHKNWTAVYIAGTAKNLMSQDFWQMIAKLAGITPAAARGDVLYHGSGLHVLHAASDGKKSISLTGTAVDEKGKEFPSVNGKVSFGMKYGETKLIWKKSK